MVDKEKLKDVFEETATALNLSGPNLNICSNQMVAIIQIEIGAATFLANILPKEKRTEGNLNELKKEYGDAVRSIVMVLESPYKDEFRNKGLGDAIGPACGMTGKNISKYLLSNIMKYRLFADEQSYGCFVKSSSEISEGVYRLCLVNAVPFRCKYGTKESDKQKTKLLDGCFARQEFKDHLQEEIFDFNPEIIINACTSNDDGGVFKGQINTLLKEKFPHKILLECNHPSSANFLEGFKSI